MNKQEWLRQEVEKLDYAVSIKEWGITIDKWQNKFDLDVICDYNFNSDEIEFYDNAIPMNHIKQFIAIFEQYKEME
ncbi:MAG: hypothetical protein Unbinned6284contig1004_47 [Prokaryotic dsDNA virus sp.]|nr:MAG: hypothetical protein Unbinned6284contig1004_47 [Prokaryotic dsDNA virus sp.]|tara:strand:+ start:7561 stop:7788 length:228 start_codon:yes stop_codon:yes gene_type:complete